MNLTAGSTVQRQSTTLIAALKTRVADQSSDACQYFRIIAEGCSSLSLSFYLPLYYFLSRQFPSFSFILLLPSSFMSSPQYLEFACKAKRVSQGKPNDAQRIGFFLMRPDALMRPGLCGWTDSGFYSRSSRIRDV